MLEEGVFNRFGMGITTTDTFVWGLPTTSWQCWGAFVVMTLWSLWMARGHLKDVFRKAWFADKRIDDDGELLSYRTATLCLAGGSAYLLGWLISAGMPWYAGLLFLPGVLIAYLGITRIVVQTGVYYVTTPIVSQAMTLTTLGSQAITPHGLATLGLSYSFFGDVQSIFMPAAAHATRVSDTMRIGRRTLGAAIGIAVIAGFILSIATIVTMGYLYGASNFRSWFYQVSSGAGVRSFEAALMTIRAPTGPDFQKLSYMASGAGVMGLLTFLQYRLPWWPLHPIGLPVAGVWMIRNQAVAIFVAWLVKSLILRFGGNSGYKSGVPFFIGLIVGHFTGVGISFLVDIIFFPGVGHPILHG
jgi:hypothetical protein